tara:strand:- start:101 stop:676 length:576 start_codon:yes stop_codon:yes gene_type:complete
MFQLIENFYNKEEYGTVLFYFINEHFIGCHQPNNIWMNADKFKAYPCYQTSPFTLESNHELINTLKKTFERQTGLKVLQLKSFLRKTKKMELEKSSCWKQLRPHVDEDFYDFAGLIYLNSNSFKDGTHFFITKDSYEPTTTIGSKFNRCVFYNPLVPHAPSTEQDIEERWVQPFFIVTKESTLERYKKNET